MLNIFPSLLIYSLWAPFFLRIVLGLIFLDLGVLKFRAERQRWMASFTALNLKPTEFFVSLYATIEIVGGLMLIVGLWTQAAALAFVIISLIEFYLECQDRTILKRDIVFYVLTLVISLSLLLTGAGTLAFDLPL